ncbi:MAG: class I SAM-dependent methyltransferase, partial [Nitrospinota bacterium]
MNFDDYIKGIEFRFLKSRQRFIGDKLLLRLFEILNISLEVINTRLPEEETGMRKRIAALCSIPKMSTFAVGAIINKAVSCMPNDTCFVNVGIWNGFTFLSGMAGNAEKKCIGVDNFTQFGGPQEEFLKRFEKYKNPYHHFYRMDYVDYFSKVHSDPIGVYLYDGEHSYDNQLKGLKSAEPFFSDNCVILVDDTNW